MKRLRLVTVFLLLVALASFLNLLVEPSKRIDRRHPDWIFEDTVFSIINLTDDQRNQIKFITLFFQNEIRPLLSQKFEKKAELWLLWKQTRPDQQKIKSLRMEIHDLKWQLAEKYMDYRLAIGNILTPEQLSRYGTIPYGRKNSYRK